MCGAVTIVAPNLLKNRFCTVQYRCIFLLVIWTLLRELENNGLSTESCGFVEREILTDVLSVSPSSEELRNIS